MAKFDVGQTGLSSPNLGAVSQVTQEVQDNSKSIGIANRTNLLQNVGTVAKQAFEGHILAGVEKDTMKVIREEALRRNPQDPINSFSTADEIFRIADEDVTPSSPVAKDFLEKKAKYDLAVKQGIMSATDFDTAIRNITRQAINRNPALSKEILATSASALNLSGSNSARELAASNQASASKQQEKIQEMLIVEANKRNISFDYSNPNFYQMGIDINNHKKIELTLKAFETTDKVTEQDFKEHGSTFIVGLFSRVEDQAMQIANDPEIKPDDKMHLINNLYDDISMKLTSDSKYRSLGNSLAFKEAIDHVEGQKSSRKKIWENTITKGTSTQLASNVATWYKSRDTAEIAQTMNQEQIKLFNQALSNTFVHNQILASGEMPNYIRALGNLAKSINEPNKVLLRENSTGKTLFNEVFTQAIASGEGIPESLYAFNINIEGLSEEDLYKAMDSFVKPLAESDKEGKENIKNMQASDIQDSLGKIKDLTTINFKGLSNSLEELKKQNIPFKINILSDGRMSVETSDSKKSMEINRRFANNINMSLKAFSNLQGHASSKEGAEDFYRPFTQFFGAPAIPEKNPITNKIEPPEDVKVEPLP